MPKTRGSEITKLQPMEECSSRDIERFMLYTNQGWEAERIAKEQHVDLDEVTTSLLKAYQYFSANNPEIARAHYSRILITLREELMTAFEKGLTATVWEPPATPGGKPRKVPDHKTQLRTITEMNTLFSNIKAEKRGPGVEFNVNLGDRQGKSATTGKLSFEAMLDKVKSERLEEEEYIDVKAEKVEVQDSSG